MYGSFYWTHPYFSDEYLVAACEALQADVAGPWSGPTSPLLTLLRSGDQTAAGIALDVYQRSGALSRFGGDPLHGEHQVEVLEVARELLSQPPSPSEMSPCTGAGANHASALNAMMNTAEGQDCDLIADALDRTVNPAVVEAAAGAAGAAFSNTDGSAHPRLLALVSAYIYDADPRLALRVRMISALGKSQSPEAIAHLLRALDRPELEIQIQAALCLATGQTEDHRELLERVTASWPDDAPYPAEEVCRVLAGEDE
ncbi:HEAT repeat domain-containing protein [Spirillospora sp. CA-108201]